MAACSASRRRRSAPRRAARTRSSIPTATASSSTGPSAPISRSSAPSRGSSAVRWPARAAVAAAIVIAFVAAFALTPPRGPRSLRVFQPARLADLEVRMWQAYYAKERVRLFSLLVTMLHEQYHYSWGTAAIEGFHLARAAATFGDLKSGYDVVLPDLEAAYAKA